MIFLNGWSARLETPDGSVVADVGQGARTSTLFGMDSPGSYVPFSTKDYLENQKTFEFQFEFYAWIKIMTCLSSSAEPE